MARDDYDLAIVGAGAAGLIAARFAAQLGARVLLAERDRIGGDCTWTGCVPSKSLIRVAKAAHEIRGAHRFGIGGASVTVDMRQVREYLQRKIQQIYEPTSPEALKREGIHVALGPASFENDHTLRIGERSVVARHYLLCTGATPVTSSMVGLDSIPHFTYHTIFDTLRLPASLIVIGGGPLGMELAQAFQRLGSQVTMVSDRRGMLLGATIVASRAGEMSALGRHRAEAQLEARRKVDHAPIRQFAPGNDDQRAPAGTGNAIVQSTPTIAQRGQRSEIPSNRVEDVIVLEDAEDR